MSDPTPALGADPAILVLLVGTTAGAIGTTVGGGSMLSIPLLIFLGLPPPVAVATDRLAGLGAAATAFVQYRRAGRIAWRYVPLLACASLAGSLIGALLLVRAAPASLDEIVGALLLVLLPAMFLQPELGIAPRRVGPWQLRLGVALYSGVQVLAGFLGAGTGPLIFTVLMTCFGITILEVAATQVVPFAVLSVSSVLVFATHGLVDYRTGLVLMAGTAVGGHLGPHVAARIGARWLRRVFAVVVVAASAKLLLR